MENQHNGKPQPEHEAWGWPGIVALLTAGGLNWLLPPALSAGPGWLVVVIAAIFAAAGLVWPRGRVLLGHATSALATFALGHAVVVLILDLTRRRGKPEELLLAAGLLWSMNILVFAAWYWRLDAGGPRRRARGGVYCGGAFLFPQVTLGTDTRRAAGVEGWTPHFMDYLFLAFNTSTAFSPTDTPVLSRWAKLLVMAQSSISLATVAMVAARAIGMF